jgi:hypothetical protein
LNATAAPAVLSLYVSALFLQSSGLFLQKTTFSLSFRVFVCGLVFYSVVLFFARTTSLGGWLGSSIVTKK